MTVSVERGKGLGVGYERITGRGFAGLTATADGYRKGESMRTFRMKYLDCNREQNQIFNGSCKPFGCKLNGEFCHAKGCPDPQDSTELIVNRFLAWPLPETVAADLCATMQGYPDRTGTNLLTAIEATEMVKHLLSR